MSLTVQTAQHCVKKTGKKVAVYEDVLDIIYNSHMSLGHSRDKWTNKKDIEKEYYGVTEGLIFTFISICPKCIPSSKTFKAPEMNPLKFILSPTIGVRAQMDLVDMTSHKTKEGYKWILRYQDHRSSFKHVNALKTRTAAEVSAALIAILGIAVMPQILQSDNSGEFPGACIAAVKK